MKIIASAGGNRNKLIIRLGTYEEVNVLDIRKYYYNKKSNEFSPTRKGITLTKDTYGVVSKTINEYSDEISDWLSPNETATDVRQDLDQHEASAIRARYESVDHSREFRKWKSPVFFESESEGATDKVVYNMDHPFPQKLKSLIEALEKEDDNVSRQRLCAQLRDAVDCLLLSFSRARNLYDNSPVISPNIIFDDLTFNWGQFLHNYFKDDLNS